MKAKQSRKQQYKKLDRAIHYGTGCRICNTEYFSHLTQSIWTVTFVNIAHQIEFIIVRFHWTGLDTLLRIRYYRWCA
jgi:hypothetical protein